MQFPEYLTLCQDWVNRGLKTELDKLTDASLPESLHQALIYTALSKGKRVRPMLVRAVCEALAGTADAALPCACAIELVHTYSLVHDDLPAMDNDDMRRGQRSCHRAFSEATAILTGDALLTMAFEVIPDNALVPADIRLKQSQVLARAAGCKGMIAGQSLDIQATGKKTDRVSLEKLHSRKTGSLIEAACMLGALSAEVEPDAVDFLAHYAHAIGLAFQVQDDILDATTTTKTLGKPHGRDAELGKATYVSLLGLDQARHQARTLRDKALAALQQGSPQLPGTLAVGFLENLAHYIVDRCS
ncbi:MAG: polyprenyl synthetase family protein [Kistimonas sp.]|nr:polyprenyl synthetase family protein [Kistimonas sp.]